MNWYSTISTTPFSAYITIYLFILNSESRVPKINTVNHLFSMMFYHSCHYWFLSQSHMSMQKVMRSKWRQLTPQFERQYTVYTNYYTTITMWKWLVKMTRGLLHATQNCGLPNTNINNLMCPVRHYFLLLMLFTEEQNLV